MNVLLQSRIEVHSICQPDFVLACYCLYSCSMTPTTYFYLLYTLKIFMVMAVSSLHIQLHLVRGSLYSFSASYLYILENVLLPTSIGPTLPHT